MVPRLVFAKEDDRRAILLSEKVTSVCWGIGAQVGVRASINGVVGSGGREMFGT